jgi:hypothetical protein
LEINGDDWSASLLGPFSHDTHWIEGWMSLKAGLDAVVTRIIPSPLHLLDFVTV